MRKGQSLDQHIDHLSMDALKVNLTRKPVRSVTNNHKTIGRGRISTATAPLPESPVDAVLFCMDDQEVVEGAVSINEFGAFVRIGLMEALFTNANHG